jgi:vancomycin resistance protein YoaR
VTPILRAGSRTKLIAALGVVAALVLVVVLLDAGLSFNKVHAGVSVSGFKIGRMSRDQAIKVLDAQVKKAQKSQIVLTDGTQRWPVLPTDLKVHVDVGASVDEAMAVSRSGNLVSNTITRFRLYFSKKDVPLRGTVDTASLDAFINKVSGALDVAAVNAGLEVQNGDIAVVESKVGRAVDKQALRDSLKNLLLTLHATVLPVPVTVVEPTIKANDTAAAADVARTIISGSVTLKNGDKKWTLTAKQLQTALDFTTQPTAGDPSKTALVPYISRKTAAAFLATITDAVKKPSKNARWTTNGKTAALAPSQNATTLDVEKTLDGLNAAVLSATNRVAKVVLKQVPPDLTTEKAKAMGIEVALGSYTTDNHGNNNRMLNVISASRLCDGILLAPGQVFDYNAAVNSHVNDPGLFQPAPAIQQDGSLKAELGGVFFAGLDVVERHNHSNYIKSYPLGRDATVTEGGSNFRFRNDMNHWILIKAYADSAQCTFTIYGTDEGRKVTYTTSDWFNVSTVPDQTVKNPDMLIGETNIKMPGQPGRSVKVVRKVTQNGKLIGTDTFQSVFPARPKVTEEGTKPKSGSTTTTTKPGTTTTTTSGSTTTTRSTTTTTKKPTTTTTKKTTTTTAKKTTTTT